MDKPTKSPQDLAGNLEIPERSLETTVARTLTGRKK